MELAAQSLAPSGRVAASRGLRRRVTSVSKVAQRYGVNANLLFTWRRRDARSAASGGEAVELLPVRVEDERALAVPIAAPGPVGRMEIVLAAGERILVGVDVDAAALARLVKALSRR